MSKLASEAGKLEQAIRLLLDFCLAQWPGLPQSAITDFYSLFGVPSTSGDAYLGAYPALREQYALSAHAATGLIVYSRSQRVIVVETLKAPEIRVLDALGQPDLQKPPEFMVPGYSVREHLYCGRGLALSVGRALDNSADESMRIFRCRGIPVLAAPQEYGAEYYLAAEGRIVFGG